MFIYINNYIDIYMHVCVCACIWISVYVCEAYVYDIYVYIIHIHMYIIIHPAIVTIYVLCKLWSLISTPFYSSGFFIHQHSNWSPTSTPLSTWMSMFCVVLCQKQTIAIGYIFSIIWLVEASTFLWPCNDDIRKYQAYRESLWSAISCADGKTFCASMEHS